jgi:hypothetical protein
MITEDNIHFLYLFFAVVICMLGYIHSGRFVRPKWKIPGKFIFYTGVSFGLALWIGPFSLIFIIGHPLVGIIFHIRACRMNYIDWLKCEPREKYLELQERWASGDLKKTGV